MLNFKNLSFTLLLMFSGFESHAGLIFAEDFSGGVPSLVGWSDSDSSSDLEVYKSNLASLYGTSETYDHDNDPTTPEITIWGALEVNDDAGQVTTVSASFFLNESIDNNQYGMLSFFSGVRNNNANGATVELVNVSQNFSLTGLLSNIITESGEWNFNSYVFDWLGTNVGDELQIIWFGGGSTSSNGLHITDVQLSSVAQSDSSTNIPEPTGIFIMAIALICLARSRKQI